MKNKLRLISAIASACVILAGCNTVKPESIAAEASSPSEETAYNSESAESSLVTARDALSSEVSFVEKDTYSSASADSSSSENSKPVSKEETSANSLASESLPLSDNTDPVLSEEEASAEIIFENSESDATDSSNSGSYEAPSVNFNAEFFKDDLFIGDSIYTGLYLYGFIPMENVAAAVGYTPYKAQYEAFDNKGITAVDYAEQRSPKHIVIMLGSNCMAATGDVDAIFETYKDLIYTLEQKCPDSTICVVSVPPVTADSSLAEYSDISNSVINRFNSLIFEYCHNNGIRYYDLNSLLSDENGCLKYDYAESDGLHFVSGAYEVMLSGLEKCLDDTQSTTDNNTTKNNQIYIYRRTE